MAYGTCTYRSDITWRVCKKPTKTFTKRYESKGWYTTEWIKTKDDLRRGKSGRIMVMARIIHIKGDLE